MLVRNHTRVPLRVELYRPKSSMTSPLADWPLVRRVLGLWLHHFEEEPGPIFRVKVGPGVEWALRPKVCEGHNFQLRMSTEAGVVVCSRALRRGQTFDFHVPVPPPPLGPRNRLHEDPNLVEKRLRGPDTGPTCSTPQQAALALFAASSLASGSQASEQPPLTCTTVAQTSASAVASELHHDSAIAYNSADKVAGENGTQTILHSSHGQAAQDGSSARADADQLQKRPADINVYGLVPCRPRSSSVRSRQTSRSDYLEAAICSRCLHEMARRRTRPAASVYACGVCCDHCDQELVVPGTPCGEVAALGDGFFHCGRCWFDLCPACALLEMNQVWWSDRRRVTPKSQSTCDGTVVD